MRLWFFSALVAALLNYHRPLLSWCGLPGVTGLYVCYFGAAALLRGRVRIDPKLSRVRDVAAYILILLSAEVPSALVGMLTLWGDGLITRSQRFVATIDWWASDSIALVTFGPFLMMYVLPWVEGWLKSDSLATIGQQSWRRSEVLETTAQALSR